RDFSKFVFKGHERWQGKWATPNIAAAVTGPMAVLLFGYALLLVPSGSAKPLRWVAFGLLAIAFVYVSWLLARTYSRGGWVAVAAGMMILLALAKHKRVYALIGIGVLGAMIAFQPAGLERTASSLSIDQDRSIANRLLIWRGA